MILREIEPLLKDMGRNKVKQEKFSFSYGQTKFDVILLIERQPFELIFGIIDANFSFTLKLHPGYVLDNMEDLIFYKLCDILNLRPSRESLTSFKFLKYFASKIPKTYSGRKVQPDEIAVYIRPQIPDSLKIYFKGWQMHETDGKMARNLEKTRKLLGDEAYTFCKKYNISSCWSDKLSDKRTYFPPDEYYTCKKINKVDVIPS